MTGASGFVGSAVVRVLLAKGQRVRVLVRPQSDRRNLDGLEVETAQGDLRDAAAVGAAVGGCGSVFHVAADYRLWTRDPRGKALYESNVDGTMNVMRACAAAGVRRAVYTSSVATLGVPGDGSPGDETTPVSLGDMVGHYKRSKFLAEEAVREWTLRTGFEVVIVNPSTPVGPRDVKPTPTGRLILDAAAGRMPAFVDTGLNVVHVDDVALGHVLAFERGVPGERYVLGGEDMTLARILEIVARHVGRRPAPDPAPARGGVADRVGFGAGRADTRRRRAAGHGGRGAHGAQEDVLLLAQGGRCARPSGPPRHRCDPRGRGLVPRPPVFRRLSRRPALPGADGAERPFPMSKTGRFPGPRHSEP